MLITETVTIKDEKFVKNYSDRGLFIERDGVMYEAVSYTHLDVYNRQVVNTINSLFINHNLVYGDVPILRWMTNNVKKYDSGNNISVSYTHLSMTHLNAVNVDGNMTEKKTH